MKWHHFTVWFMSMVKSNQNDANKPLHETELFSIEIRGRGGRGGIGK